MNIDFWKEKYQPDRILSFDVNKCFFIKNNHLHFVLWDLSGQEAIHLIDEEIRQIIHLDNETLNRMFQYYLTKDY